MIRYSCGFMLIIWLLSFWAHAQAQTLAFPGAEGFGRFAKGGRGGRVIEVTNLNDSGPGSLRAALEASGPRTVVFRIGGTIQLADSIIISNPYVTIAGQTAPGDGIQIRGEGLLVTAHDVIIRYLRIRPGPDVPEPSISDALGFYGPDAYNIIADHVSLSWAIDETFSIWHRSHHTTIQWSIIAESLPCPPGTSTTDACGGHKGFLTGATATQYSSHHNLLAKHKDRNPFLQSGDAEFINNVTYHYGPGVVTWPASLALKLNFIGNYYVPGSSTPNEPPIGVGGGPNACCIAQSGIYVGGNIHPVFRPNNSFLESSITRTTGPAPYIALTGTKFNYPTMDSTTDAFTAYNEVLDNAGAIRPVRDAVDARIVSEVRNRTGSFINSPNDVGGYVTLSSTNPPLDSDHDGMPDSWEISHGLNPNDAADGPQTAANGYTNLENHLNELDGDAVPGSEPPITHAYTVLKTSTSINLDGDLTEFSDVPEIILTATSGSIGTYKLLWDENNLYIGAEVSDDQLNADITDHDGALYRDDSIELYFDTHHNDGASRTDDNVTLLVNLLDVRADFNVFDPALEVNFSSSVVLNGTNNDNSDADSGYTMELAIPWSSLNLVVPQEDLKLGFDLIFNDKREDGSRIYTAWKNSNGGTPNDPAGWGDIILSSELRVMSQFNPPTNLRIVSP